MEHMSANGNGRRRVVITGLGMVSPLGNDVESSWKALLAGESGAAEITSFDHTDYGVHFACELKDFDPTVWLDRHRHWRTALLPGVPRRPPFARPGSRQPVLDPVDHPEHGCRLGLDRARHQGAADVGVHGVRRV